MTIKGNGEIQRIFTLWVFVALSVALSGCGGGSSPSSNNSAATPDVNRNAPQTQVQATPTPDPVQAIFGDWETDNQEARNMSGATTPFVRWKIQPAVKDQSGVYTGKLTDPDRSNVNLADYKIGPQNTMTLEFLAPPAPAKISTTYEYEVSSDGNTLTLKTGSQPIILKKGTANRDILTDVAKISSPSPGAPPNWEPLSNTKDSIKNKYGKVVDLVRFDNALPSGEGYGGQMQFLLSGAPVQTGSYIISSKNTVTLDIGAGRTPAKYALEQNGDLLKITFSDGTEWVFNRK